MQDKKTKRRYCKKQIEAMLNDSKEDMLKMIDSALSSGGVPDEWMRDNYLLAKAIINIYFSREPYASMNLRTRKEFKNLSYFI